MSEMSSNSPTSPSQNSSDGTPISPALMKYMLPPAYISVQALLDLRAETGRQASALIANSGLLSSFKLLDRSAIGMAIGPQIESTIASITKSFLGDSMTSANLSSQFAAVYLNNVIDSLRPMMDQGQLYGGIIRDLQGLSVHIEQHSRLLSGLKPLSDIALPIVHATKAWEETVRSSTLLEPRVRISRIDTVGRGTGWAIQSGVALTETDPDDVAALYDETVAVLGPAHLNVELRQRLEAVHPNIAIKWSGVWERIEQGGTDASSQAANSLMEVVDWTLRTKAPEPEVLQWHEQEGLASTYLHNNKPTRRLRLRYIVRNQADKQFALDLYSKTINELVEAIEGRKHSLEINPQSALLPLIASAQGFLLFLLSE